jgi:hypothetical protein
LSAYLADTNIHLRWAQPGDPLRPIAISAVDSLRLRGDDVVITPQNLVESWNVATRRVPHNGLGFTPPRADRVAQQLEHLFPLVPDIPALHTHWRSLVVSTSVSGRQVHDTRLVAVMLAHGLTHLLTFNTADSARFPGITVVDPASVPTGP